MAWQKGQSGNPGGRPRQVGDLRELARQHTESAINALVAVLEDPESPAAARVAAASAILDRGYGKPTQAIEASVGPLEGLSHAELAAMISVLRESLGMEDEESEPLALPPPKRAA